ncbi:MAG TPA: sulfide/dihydroorotate dehydrogenase-like FAD/NAD-binding protein [Thermotogales bacterium]|nr:sulfide/dihydroorotate dehydrogenase-like FAD/NAD-binding protein [Thermotogales bacterium]
MGYRITKKMTPAENIVDLWVEAPLIASHAKAGQFIVVRLHEKGERIPLTIAEKNSKEIRIIFQVVGKTTLEFSMMKEGDEIADVTGPLGNPSEIENYGDVLVIGGGVGIAAIYPIIVELKKAGNNVTAILGARSSRLLILKDEIAKYVDELIITTDDGSEGMKGFVTDAFKKLIADGRKFKVAWAIGPTIMMKFCSLVAKEHDIPIWTSLNPIMVDGTGMCGACRVEVNGEIKFACVDGPEFDGRFVNWDELLRRLKQYETAEKKSLEIFERSVRKDG